MSNNKQSSIQQFWDKIALKLTIDQLNEFMPLFEQNKEMHREEITQTFENGYSSGYRDNGDSGVDYYEETFGSNK